MHGAFLVHSKGLDCLVFSHPETVVMLRGCPVYLLGLLPAFACLGLSKRGLTALGAVMIETIQFDSEFGRAQRHRHVDLVRGPGPLVGRVEPDLTVGIPRLVGTLP